MIPERLIAEARVRCRGRRVVFRRAQAWRGPGADAAVRWAKGRGRATGAVVGGEGVAAGQFDLLAMENAVEAILDRGALFDEGAPMSQQSAKFAGVAGWDPHFRNEISGCRCTSAMRPLARWTASGLSVLTAACAIYWT